MASTIFPSKGAASSFAAASAPRTKHWPNIDYQVPGQGRATHQRLGHRPRVRPRTSWSFSPTPVVASRKARPCNGVGINFKLETLWVTGGETGTKNHEARTIPLFQPL